jgi:hypothetical protein
MAKTFEELLAGRMLHELTDTEVEELIKEMSLSQMKKFSKEVSKASKRKKAPSKNVKKNMDEFDKLLFK